MGIQTQIKLFFKLLTINCVFFKINWSGKRASNLDAPVLSALDSGQLTTALVPIRSRVHQSKRGWVRPAHMHPDMILNTKNSP
jgi:hypothetical protein